MVKNYTKSFSALREMRDLLPKEERSKLNIKNIKEGSFVKLNGNLCLVKAIFTYSAGNEKWYEYELFAINSGKTIYIEYEEDDRIEMYLTIDSFNMRDLPVSSDDIEDMADEEDGSFNFKGTTFFYEDDYKATFSRNNESEKVYLYEFSNEKEDTFLTIEEWGSEKDGYEYKAHLSVYLNENNLEIISL